MISGLRSLLDAVRGSPEPPVAPIPGAPRVLLISSWTRPDDGWDVAARLHARAMRLGGVDCRLVSDGRSSPYSLTPEVLAEVGDAADAEGFDPEVCVLSYPALHGGEVARRYVEFGRPDGWHAVFERVAVDPEVARTLRRCRVVWAQCRYNLDALRAADAPVATPRLNVALLPVPWFPDDPLLSVPAPTRADRFLYVGRAEQRKSPHDLVRAFCAAFRPGEATLTMKLSRWTNRAQAVQDPEAVAAELGRSADFRFVRGTLIVAAMASLYATHDVYCSASRGEGWDLCAYAAKLAGLRYAGHDSGGPADFAADGDVLVPRVGVAPDGYGAYSFDDLVAALQEARRAPGSGSRPPRALRADVVGARHREVWGALVGR